MTFIEWINSDFKNSSAAAKSLGIPYSTLRSYYDLERFPRATALQILVLKSKNKLDTNAWLSEYIAKQRGRTC
jgi:hypothetical protein